MTPQSLDDAILTVESRPAAYVLLGADRSYLYKGSCRDLRERLKDHRAGRSSRTKNRRPLSLVHYQYFEAYQDASARERYLKTGQGRTELQRLITVEGQTVPPKADPPPAGNLLALPS